MKKTNRLFAGMAALAISLSFASCGKASVVSDEVKVNDPKTAKTADTSDPDAAAKNLIYDLLSAAQNGDKSAYVEAMNKELMTSAVKTFYGQDIADSDWDDLVSESWDGIADEMKNISGDYTIENYTTQDELRENFDNGSTNCISFSINDGSYEIWFTGSTIELDGEMTVYLNLGSPNGDDVMMSTDDVQLANSKTLWNAAAQLCYEVGFDDGEYSFCLDEPGENVMGQKIHEMFGDDFSGYGYVKVVDGQPECARWTATEGADGQCYPSDTETEE